MIRLHSPMSIEDCFARLRSELDPPWKIFGRKPVVGTVTRARLLVHKRTSVFVRNSFQPHLSATFQPDGGGTSITCRFVLHPFTVAFMVLWVTAVLLVGGGAVGELVRPNHSDEAWAGVFVLFGMLAFAAALVGGGWWLNASDKDRLIKFLTSKLQAVAAPPNHAQRLAHAPGLPV